jgi:hypothetical protein
MKYMIHLLIVVLVKWFGYTAYQSDKADKFCSKAIEIFGDDCFIGVISDIYTVQSFYKGYEFYREGLKEKK